MNNIILCIIEFQSELEKELIPIPIHYPTSSNKARSSIFLFVVLLPSIADVRWSRMERYARALEDARLGLSSSGNI